MRSIIGVFLLFIIFLFSCNSKKEYHISVYHWKLDTGKDSILSSNHSFSHLYLHIMDVEWNENLQLPIPKNSIQINKEQINAEISITPVFFISPKVFSNIDSTQIEDLVTKILKNRTQFLSNKQLKDEKTLQIDCDWLASNKDNYFAFLRTLKSKDPTLTISVTIRLYPFKYKKKMGVPPVDFGVLMCYNMDEIKNVKTRNSILDNSVLIEYLKENDYPLMVKPAIPIFGWYVGFGNNGEYKGILYLDKTFIDNSIFTSSDDERYLFQKDTVIQSIYFREGDFLRREFPTTQQLSQSIHILQDNIPKFDEIILYHWDNNKVDSNYEKFFKEYNIKL